jgi:hypothetical protein
MTPVLAQIDPALTAWTQHCVRQAQAVHTTLPATDPGSPHGHLCLLCQQVWEHASQHCPAGEVCLCPTCYVTAYERSDA